MTSARLTETVEDYLQLIYTMKREGAPIIAARVKERKGVSAPTAWATLKRMERDGLIEIVSNHRIELTREGEDLSESILRRHMLAERMLIDVLKLDWADVHEEAEHVQHAISPLIEKQLLMLLGNPTTCPHGNPIPGLFNYETAPPTMPLRVIAEGEFVTITNIAEHAEDDLDLMRYLQRNSLLPNMHLKVDEVALANSTITVSLLDKGSEKVVIGLPTAEFIYVRREPA